MSEPTFSAANTKLDLPPKFAGKPSKLSVGCSKWNSIVILWSLLSLLIELDWQCPDLNMLHLIESVS